MGEKLYQQHEFATFSDRLKPAFMDYIGAWMLFFVGGLCQSPLFGIGIAGVILGSFCDLLGIIALLFINGYVPALNRGQTPNKKSAGVMLMKIVNKETMELRQITDDDLGILLLRAFIGWFEIFILIIPGIIPLLVINTSQHKQRLADMLANTVMVKVEPVEKINLKEFRYKRSSPYLEGDAIPSAKLVSEKETTTITSTKVAEGIFTDTQKSFLNISKILILLCAILLIISNIVIIAFQINITTVNSIILFGGSVDAQLWFAKLQNGFFIISYVMNFILLGGFILVLISLPSEHKKHFILASVFFFLYILFWIIGNEINASDNKLFAFIDLGLGSTLSVSISITYFVLARNLAFIFLIVSIFMINNGIKSLANANLIESTKLKSNIFLIIMTVLHSIVVIIGYSARPEEIFGIVMFYLLRLTYMILIGAVISFNVGVLKLRRIKT